MLDGVGAVHDECAKLMAKALVVRCMRKGYLEKLHVGKFPVSLTGDNSDIRLVGPEGEVPWNEVSRISDPEMKRLMKEIVDRVYTVLLHENDDEYMADFLNSGARHSYMWDEPEVNPRMVPRK